MATRKNTVKKGVHTVISDKKFVDLQKKIKSPKKKK